MDTCKLIIQLNLFLRFRIEWIPVLHKLVLVVLAVVMGSGDVVAAQYGADVEGLVA